MRRLLKQVSDRLQAFIAQRDDVALVITSAAGEAPPLLKMIETIEETSTSDFFWTFTDPFTAADAYADTIVRSFTGTHAAVRLSMEKEGMTLWPAIPPAVLSTATPPAQRLRELAAFSRELLPIPNGGVVIWSYVPLEIANGGAFATLMAQILEHAFPFPWYHHLRFIIREDPGDRQLHKRLHDARRVQWYTPDLSLEAVNRSLQEEIDDERLPLAERLSMLTLMAANDAAYQRYPEALEKYALLLRFHAPSGNYPMAALALNSMGEVYQKMGEIDRANESFEAALAPASQGEHPAVPILLNIVLNLANLRLAQERWEDAEAYYDMAQQLATVNRDAGLKIRSLENRGVCQQRQGKVDDAVQSWSAGAALAAGLQDVELCRALLTRLQQHYAQTRQTAKEREVREQLTALGGSGA